MSKNYKKYLNKNLIAGSVCIGPYSSMALSDYGPTQHSLPTISSSKFSSGLGVKDFITQTSYNELSKKGVAKLGKSGILLSETESLIGHSRSIKKEWRKIKLPKEDILEYEGKVLELLPQASFKILLDNGHEVKAVISGRFEKIASEF